MGDQRKRAAIFSRESKGKGSSIDDQDRENLAAANDLDAEVTIKLRDTVGASRFTAKTRVGWPEIIELVKSDAIDLLIVWEVARADRTMDTWVPFITACGKHGVMLHITSLEMTYNPRKAAHRKALLDMGSSAEAETGVLSERSKKGIIGAALAGKSHGRAAFGYTREYGPIVDGQRTFTEVPNEFAPIVEAIIARIARHDPITTIVAELTEAGVPTPTGGERWHRNSLRHIVMRPTYAGMREHNGQLFPGSWKPIVPEHMWRMAKAVLEEPGRKTTAPGRYKWLLSYLAKANCGGVMSSTQKPPRRRAYRCIEDGCLGIGAAELDEYLTQVAFARLAQPDARDTFLPNTDEYEAASKAVDQVQAELDDLAAQIAKGPANGGISAALAAQAEPGILVRLGAAKNRLAANVGHGAVLELLGEGEVTEDVLRPRWERLSVPGRRQIIHRLFKEIVVLPTEERLTRWSSDEDRLRLASERVDVTWRE